ncbi:uncharacterized protein LOC115329798 [Ixodes scapularis]|uniref:uncharacterized protein LOC115329798 n=1 Tax=Ixodes scapularis TaxID=6945 RepID=UPI001A9F1F51|nr:uncharacterized protein LOC115329798 [Ixodes scapularis]
MAESPTNTLGYRIETYKAICSEANTLDRLYGNNQGEEHPKYGCAKLQVTKSTSIMALALSAVTGLICLTFSSGSQSWPELNPDLEQYQDFTKCFPLQESWYTIYRNYESDPVFGGSEKCIKYTESGPPVNGAYPLHFDFGNQSGMASTTLESSPGYTGKNILSLTPTGGSTSVEVYGAYAECEQCLVLRNTYISNTACALLVPESVLNKNTTCCDFIFDLLCGTMEKYYIYDASC